jgi:hypothetical protein
MQSVRLAKKLMEELDVDEVRQQEVDKDCFIRKYVAKEDYASHSVQHVPHYNNNSFDDDFEQHVFVESTDYYTPQEEKRDFAYEKEPEYQISSTNDLTNSDINDSFSSEFSSPYRDSISKSDYISEYVQTELPQKKPSPKKNYKYAIDYDKLVGESSIRSEILSKLNKIENIITLEEEREMLEKEANRGLLNEMDDLSFLTDEQQENASTLRSIQNLEREKLQNVSSNVRNFN